MITEAQIEALYEAHDELASADIKKGDRNLASEYTFQQLLIWQYRNYQTLLLKCMQAAGEQPEFKKGRKLLRLVEFEVRNKRMTPREGTAKMEQVLMAIHTWLDKARRELSSKSS